MVYILLKRYDKVSCDVVVGWVLKAAWTGVRILQACCVSCRRRILLRSIVATTAGAAVTGDGGGENGNRDDVNASNRCHRGSLHDGRHFHRWRCRFIVIVDCCIPHRCLCFRPHS